MDSTEKLLDEVDTQIDFLLNVRSLFPYPHDESIGKQQIRTAPFYSNQGYDVHFQFDKPLTEEHVAKIKAIGHWVNQNFVVRLCAILESYGVIPRDGEGKINQNLEGSIEVDLVRRLRNQFAHSSGRYNSKDQKERKLYSRIVDHFNVTEALDPDIATDYPISIDIVLLPLAEGCKKYITNIYLPDV